MTITNFGEQFFALADEAMHIVITSHISPDDDSIGSVLSVYTLLTDSYPKKNIRIVYTGTPVERYNSFYNFDKIEWVDDVANHLDGVDMLIGLDASKYTRFSRLPEKLQAVPVRVAIDHHASTPDEFSLLLFETSYPANCAVIYDALFQGGPIRKEVAEHILLGIIGDTGSFTYISPEQASVLELGATLLRAAGTRLDAFKSRYMGIPVRIIPLLQALVANTIYVSDTAWPPFQYSYIPRDVMTAGNYNDDDMSAASHIYIGQYLPKVEGFTWGFVVSPRVDGTCRASSRSLPGSVNVRDLSERLGIGGGHDGSSGATFTESDPQACIARVLNFTKANTPVLRQ